MIKKSTLKLIILGLGIIFALLPSIYVNFNVDQRNNENGVDIRDEIIVGRPKTSGTYPKSFIHIDGSIPNNWSLTADGNAWCYYENGHYIIENVTIDASSSPTGSGIFINNSKADYFIIRNCNVTNAGSGIYDAGIKLENTKNGTLASNNCSNNGRTGILLSDNCSYNTLSGNTVSQNDYGINLWDNCSYNTLSGNTANNDYNYGIYLWNNCDYNNITGNTANENIQQGIILNNECDNNILSGNTANNNDDTGINLYKSDNNTLSGNTVINNDDTGIMLYDCDNNTLSGNTANNNDDTGINLYDCDNNNITENLIFANKDGIMLDDCDDNLIFYNYIINNTGYNAIDDDGVNDWDNGAIGNYWSNYTGTDEDHDGIGDTFFTVFGTSGSIDYKPIMNTNPLFFNLPDDLTYKTGVNGNSITWSLINISPSPLAFVIFRDGTFIKLGTLDSYVTYITINVDGLAIGNHKFTIVVDDGSGGTITDTVWVKVRPTSDSIVENGDNDDNDDDDKDEELNILLPALITVGVISAIGISGVVFYLKKKQMRA